MLTENEYLKNLITILVLHFKSHVALFKAFLTLVSRSIYLPLASLSSKQDRKNRHIVKQNYITLQT